MARVYKWVGGLSNATCVRSTGLIFALALITAFLRFWWSCKVRAPWRSDAFAPSGTALCGNSLVGTGDIALWQRHYDIGDAGLRRRVAGRKRFNEVALAADGSVL